MDQQENDTILLIVVTTALIVFFAGLVINLLLYARNRKLKHHAELQDLKLNFERNLLSTRLEVTESTLEEVAADLHDDVGQMLTVAILELNKLEEAHGAKAAVKAGLESLRAISKSLSPEYMKSVGFQQALNRMADRIHKQGEVEMVLHVDEDVAWTDQNQALFVFRILQELVTNTLKYAQASRMEIRIQKETDMAHIAYTDNGKGFDMGADAETAGMGLMNVRRRVAVLNGTIAIHSTPGAGFSADLRLPLS